MFLITGARDATPSPRLGIPVRQTAIRPIRHRRAARAVKRVFEGMFGVCGVCVLEYAWKISGNLWCSAEPVARDGPEGQTYQDGIIVPYISGDFSEVSPEISELNLSGGDRDIFFFWDSRA